MVRTMQNFQLFDQKWLIFFDNVLTPFWKTFLLLKQLFDAKLLIQRLSSFSREVSLHVFNDVYM